MDKRTTKRCPRCGEEKSISEFNKNSTQGDGLQAYCRVCSNLCSNENTHKLPDRINVEEFVETTHRMDSLELARHWKSTPGTIKRWKRAARIQGFEVGTIRKAYGATVNDYEPPMPEVEPAGFPESVSTDKNDFPIIEEDRLLIFGDVEVPDHDVRVLDMAYRIAERYGIKTGIINGDFWAMESFSRWPKTHPTQFEFLTDELQPGTEILKVFMKQLDRITIVEGNHERRLNRQAGGHFNVSAFLEGLMGVAYCTHPYLVVESAGERVLVGHPNNYRKKPGSLPLEHCNNYLMNVIVGHVHRLSFQFHPSGQFWGVEGGHCRDTKKTEYRMKQFTTHPIWNPGFVLLLDGWPHLIMPQNYEAYLEPHHDIARERKAPREPEEILQMRAALAKWEARNAD